MHGLLADFFARVLQRSLAGRLGQSESMRVTKACVRLLRIRTCVEQVTRSPPTASGGQRNLFLTVHTLFS